MKAHDRSKNVTLLDKAEAKYRLTQIKGRNAIVIIGLEESEFESLHDEAATQAVAYEEPLTNNPNELTLYDALNSIGSILFIAQRHRLKELAGDSMKDYFSSYNDECNGEVTVRGHIMKTLHELKFDYFVFL